MPRYQDRILSAESIFEVPPRKYTFGEGGFMSDKKIGKRNSFELGPLESGEIEQSPKKAIKARNERPKEVKKDISPKTIEMKGRVF